VRVILDTNILLSGLIAPAGVPGRLVDTWLDGRFTLVSHSLQLDEFRAVSRREKIRVLVRSSEAGRLVNQIAALADMRPSGYRRLNARAIPATISCSRYAKRVRPIGW
jgi:predicted nucleic acid-binding protein